MPDADDGHEADYIYEAELKYLYFYWMHILKERIYIVLYAAIMRAVYDVTSAFIRRGRKRTAFGRF